jgi:methylated-DNA-protein-cysteine methyltransferase-like protein
VPATIPLEHQPLYARIYLVVRQIPPGRVATYGQIAGIVGDCTARMVGYAMAAAPDDVPWQRVINAQGKVSPRHDHWGAEAQRRRLQEEGVLLDERAPSTWRPCAGPAPTRPGSPPTASPCRPSAPGSQVTRCSRRCCEELRGASCEGSPSTIDH